LQQTSRWQAVLFAAPGNDPPGFERYTGMVSPFFYWEFMCPAILATALVDDAAFIWKDRDRALG
jgi:hypothetical protein